MNQQPIHCRIRMPIRQQDQVHEHAAVGQAADPPVVLFDGIPAKPELATIVPVEDRVGGGLGDDQIAKVEVEPGVPHAQRDRIIDHLHLQPLL